MTFLTRKTSEYRNENGGVLNVHKVTEDTQGGVYLTGVGNEVVKPGELITQDNANSWTRVNSLDGYTAVDGGIDDVAVESADVESEEEVVEDHPDDYDPSEHKVGEVLRYIDRHQEAADDIRAKEAEGRARKSIVGA